MMNKALIDSSFLYVLLNPKQKDYERANITIKALSQLIVPYVVLTEVAFLFNREGGILAVTRFINTLIATKLTYEILIPEDFVRMSNIMTTYRDAKFDFVDACLMALSERLNITLICTLDQRDFSIFRPRHVDRLELLP
ncbi:MAG: PIN domain-containing protein [bacterium]|nr:PIN domain-containing protein [bacterium]